jgi:hypothetical protein
MARVVAVSTGTLALVAFLVLGAAGPHQVRAALQSLARPGDYVDSGVRIVPPPAPASSSLEENKGEDLDGGSKTDFEGDDVSPALATYGIDREGNLFEVHSPHTEVPRLAGPTI